MALARAEVRQDGGFLFHVESLDPHAAVARIAELLDQLAARMAVGTKRGLALLGHVWIEGAARAFRLDRARRGVWVEALETRGISSTTFVPPGVFLRRL